MPDYDLLIAGGGLVGASLACALRGRGLRMAIVEARPPSAASDPRRLALAYSSRCILHTLNVWPTASCPIHTVHVSQQGRFGQVHLRHHEFGVPALGYVVAAQALNDTLWQPLQHCPDLDRLRPASIEQVSLHPEAVQVTLNQPSGTRRVSTRLLVAADGGRSAIREQLKIPVFQHDYRQFALLADVHLPQPHRHIAYERFTADGVFALLPMTQQRATLVHTVKQNRLESLLALDDAAFAAYINAAFNGYLPRQLTFGPRLKYPLHLLKARQQTRQRTVLIGNAAHTLHPVAGQGFNLGLRDAAVLAESIAAAQCAGEDIGAVQTLQRYARERDRDQHTSIAFTDGLVRLFGLPLPPVPMARSLGLTLLDSLPTGKRLLAQQMMGLNGRQSRLARGLTLPQATRGADAL